MEEEVREPIDTYNDRLVDGDGDGNREEEERDREEIEKAIQESLRVQEKYFKDLQIQEKIKKLEKYGKDCPVQKAIILMLNHQIEKCTWEEVHEYFESLVDITKVLYYIDKHPGIIDKRYITHFI